MSIRALPAWLLLCSLYSVALAQPVGVSNGGLKPVAPPPVAPPPEPPPASPAEPPPITLAELQILTGGPTPVTLIGRALPLDAVTKVLMEAADVTEPRLPNPNPNYQRRVNADWNGTPFWEAARQVEKQTGDVWMSRFGSSLELNPYSNEKKGLGGVVAAQNPFVTLIANSTSRYSRRIALFGLGTAQQEPDRFHLNFSAYFDPRLRIQATAFRDVKFQVRGETALRKLERNDSDFDHLNFRGPNLLRDLYLVAPADFAPGTVLTRLSGVLHCQIVAATQEWAVPDLLATSQVTKTVSNDQLTLENVKSENDQLTLRLSVAPSVGANRLNQRSFYSNLRVRDGEGRELSQAGSTGGSNGATLSFYLKNSDGKATAGPYSLRWIVPTQMRSFDVPFELRDVVVP